MGYATRQQAVDDARKRKLHPAGTQRGHDMKNVQSRAGWHQRRCFRRARPRVPGTALRGH